MESHDEVDVVESEEHSRPGAQVDRARHHRVRIDDQAQVVHTERLSVSELVLAGERDCTYRVVEESRDRANYVVDAREELDLLFND